MDSIEEPIGAVDMTSRILSSVLTQVKLELKDALIDFLQKMTSYDVPQIIYKKFNSEKKYLNWVNKTFSI